MSSLRPGCPRVHLHLCVQENPTPGIPVLCTGRFSKVFIYLKLQKCHSLYKLWRNSQKYLSCLIWEPDFLRDVVTSCRNPLRALGSFGNFLLNVSYCPGENVSIWFNSGGSFVV